MLQIPHYMTWKPDPNSFATDAMQQDWNKMFPLAFFQPDKSVDNQSSSEKCRHGRHNILDAMGYI